MRKFSTAARRQEVGRLYQNETLPLEERSSRALGKRFGVSHRTILNDLGALGVRERHEKPRAGGIAKEERQRIVRELYPMHTCAEIAEQLGCSVQPIKSDVRELGLGVRKAAPRRKRPVPDPHPCGCGCGELARPGGNFKSWNHYTAWRDAQLEAVATEAVPLWNEGATLDEISERLVLPRHRIEHALRKALPKDAPRRPSGKPLGKHYGGGAFVKCKARGHDFCPHGERERWVYTSQHVEFLSKRCWARYRSSVAWRSLLPLVASTKADDRAWLRWNTASRRRWGGRLGAVVKGGRPRGRASYWNEGVATKLDAAREAFVAAHGRQPSLRDLARVTGIPKSTIARLSQKPS